jgi:dTMP kinase|tara:strand:+ start:27056 stop:27739 length:684 start_codon:yes stop_codon:yes gene_type:complete
LQTDSGNPGLFITVEGVEGAGKSTNLTLIVECLEQSGIEVVSTREPGGTPFAESVRELLLAPRDESVDEITELLLMFAARSQHLNALIRPSIASGKWIVCDRFTDATYAYQGGGRELGFDLVAKLEDLVQGGFRPDRTFYLDVPLEQGMQRVGERGEKDRFELEQSMFFERVRNAYLSMVEREPERFILIDASQPLENVQADVRAQVANLLAGYQSGDKMADKSTSE